MIGGWVVVRPLLKPQGDKAPSAMSRDHKILRIASGLVTVGGGKLTAFWAMAGHVLFRGEVEGGRFSNCWHEGGGGENQVL